MYAVGSRLSLGFCCLVFVFKFLFGLVHKWCGIDVGLLPFGGDGIRDSVAFWILNSVWEFRKKVPKYVFWFLYWCRLLVFNGGCTLECYSLMEGFKGDPSLGSLGSLKLAALVVGISSLTHVVAFFVVL